VAVADRLLPCRGNIDRFQRQCNFNQFLLIHGWLSS
jgi:hypothetical protein